MSAQTDNTILTLLDQLIAQPPKTHEALAAQTGLSLVKVDTGNQDIEFAAQDGNEQLDVVRHRQLNRANTSEIMIQLKIHPGVAPAKADVTARYDDLAITAVPRGRSPMEELQLTQTYEWGRACFGFADRAPDVLRSAIITIVPD